MQVRVREVTAAETHPVRRLVLREGRAESVVEFPGDDVAGALHLAAFADDGAGPMVGVATFFPSPLPVDGRPAFQLRGMAVLPELQGSGVGTLLLDEGVARLREAGVPLVWANGRDSALGFYERRGWKVVGDGYEYGPMSLPHHLVTLALDGGD
jgi:GNAT superfamily N-acetyltransferase